MNYFGCDTVTINLLYSHSIYYVVQIYNIFTKLFYTIVLKLLILHFKNHDYTYILL